MAQTSVIATRVSGDPKVTQVCRQCCQRNWRYLVPKWTYLYKYSWACDSGKAWI